MPTLRSCLAEFIGTFALVFAGTGAIVANDLSGGAITHVGIALTFGLIVFAMIAVFGDVSGAHLNPAVTLGLWMASRIRFQTVLPYVGSQLLGAFTASLTVRVLFPGHETLGLTSPSGTIGQSFGLELLLTLLLVLVILTSTAGRDANRMFVALAVGSTVGLEAMFAGPICGASMNPARSFGPAFVAWQLGSLWIYLLAPVIGAIVAVPVCRCVRESSCCRATNGATT